MARGNVLNVLVDSPTYEVSEMGQVPYIDVAGTLNPEDGKVSLFLLNRDLNMPHTVEIEWQDRTPGKVLSSTVLTGSDLKAFNSFDAPQRVAPQPMDKPSTSGSRTKFELPPRSYTAIQWSA
jgi:alpha-N-arabinofuranosidase